ncbi:MAG: 50S ribosomal protein L11 methyltransferase [Bacteroidota bacterium]
MSYLELDFKIDPVNPGSDILMAELGEIGCESFVENEDGIIAYIKADVFNLNDLTSLQILHNLEYKVKYTIVKVEDQNWNAVWESNYEPVVIAGKCGIRAPFHPENKDVIYDLVIEPKMSFGTAHHETTSQMIELLLEEDVKGKKVLDMGCGTGVLAVLSAKLGGIDIIAIDNDEWAYANSLENIVKNNEEGIKVLLGDATLLNGLNFDIIIANINRNILLNDIRHYVSCLNKDGILMMSGFYENDIPAIKEECLKYNLKFDRYICNNNWVAVRFIK